jgi:hypothetical protein
MPDEARCSVNVTIHPWCSDVARDERVRAAEDGRGGALPTLEECIAGVTERMSIDAGGEESSQGPWRCGDAGKAVRVVSDNETDAEMLRHALAKSVLERLTAIRERDEAQARVAELEAASGGGEGEADAWGIVRDGNVESVTHRGFRRDADEVAEQFGGSVVPLYRAPPQPRGWLTGEEREAITLAAAQAPESDFVTNEEGRHLRAVLTALLARSTPPEPEGDG